MSYKLPCAAREEAWGEPKSYLETMWQTEEGAALYKNRDIKAEKPSLCAPTSIPV